MKLKGMSPIITTVGHALRITPVSKIEAPISIEYSGKIGSNACHPKLKEKAIRKMLLNEISLTFSKPL